jgi:hypothetical protein
LQTDVDLLQAALLNANDLIERRLIGAFEQHDQRSGRWVKQ